jgi:hypothetical protein
MRDLAEQIASSQYGSGLNPITSHATLILSPHERFNFLNDEVRIDFIDGQFQISYKGGPSSATWVKRDRDGFAALERFLHHIRWFVEYRSPSGDSVT